MPSQAGVNIENVGLAVFKEDKFVGELNAIQTICHLIVSNKLKTCTISVPSPVSNEYSIDLELNVLRKTKNKVYIVNGNPFITSDVFLTARVTSLAKNSEYLTEESISQIEDYANSYLKSHIEDYLYTTSKIYCSDIANFGKYAVSSFLTWDDWIEYNWLESYRNAFFKVNVDVTVKSSFLFQKL